MKRVSFDDKTCSVARSLEQIGEWWTLLIVRDALFGVRRFEDFQRELGISRNILTTRLDKLVADGILDRRRYQDKPARYEYVLTDKGKELWQVITLIRQWGDRWVTGPGDEPIRIEHQLCGHESNAVLVCDHCNEPLAHRDLRAVAGPGDRDEWMEALVARPRERPSTEP